MMYTMFPLTGQTWFPVIGTVPFPLTSVRLTGAKYTEFVNGTSLCPVNGSPVNEFRREVPVNGNGVYFESKFELWS